jgi:ABC-type branched-subunit amino acid transport system ATPase component
VISCLFVSVAGALYALLNNFTDPRALRFDLSGNFVIMAVLGGMRSFWGPLIGAAIFVALQDYVSSHTENWMSVIGLVFVLVVRFFPRGVLGMLRGEPRRDRASGRRRLEALRKPGRHRRRVAHDRAGRAAGDHRPERRRQDDVLQSRQRPLRADRGLDKVRWSGCHRASAGRAGAARHGAHFPDHRDFSRAPVADNIRVAVEIAAGYRLKPWLGAAARAVVAARVDELLDMGGLSDKSDVRAGALSHGDQRAAEIMMSLALRPRLLMLDEPTAGMGDQETYDIARLIRRLHRQEGLTIMLIEHDMRVVFNLADRIMVLAEGRVLAEGAPQEIADSDKVQAAYLGKAAA